MFDSLNLNQEIDKKVFDAEEPGLRAQLIETQYRLLESDVPVIVVLAGVDALGRSDSAKQILNWMDSRHIRPFASMGPTDEEADRPRMWRYWRALPRKGRIGLFLNSWYDMPMRDYFIGRISESEFDRQVNEVLRFEELLTQEGALMLKFMFVLPKKQHRIDAKKRATDSVAWKTSKEEQDIAKEYFRRYDHAMGILDELLAATSKTYAPWKPVASADPHHRDLTVGRTLVEAISDRLDSPPQSPPISSNGLLSKADAPNVLDTLDLSKSLPRDDYKINVKEEQRRLTSFTLSKKFEERSLIAVFEGTDAAGKGGAIRRVVRALDPRMMRVIPISAPSDEELAQPYLWRFWRHIPRKGHVTVFDRSWYGRVLVERVEALTPEHDWKRAYEEIRSFEAELHHYGAIIVKFWLSIDKDVQLQRFRQRETVTYKKHKITPEDWRNRENWDAYRLAVNDMVDRTSVRHAPWTLVEANDKYFARVKILKTINERLEDEL